MDSSVQNFKNFEEVKDVELRLELNRLAAICVLQKLLMINSILDSLISRYPGKFLLKLFQVLSFQRQPYLNSINFCQLLHKLIFCSF